MCEALVNLDVLPLFISLLLWHGVLYLFSEGYPLVISQMAINHLKFSSVQIIVTYRIYPPCVITELLVGDLELLDHLFHFWWKFHFIIPIDEL